jgi:hypothetical protein
MRAQRRTQKKKQIGLKGEDEGSKTHSKEKEIGFVKKKMMFMGKKKRCFEIVYLYQTTCL